MNDGRFHYARNGDARIAYRMLGDGETTVVFVLGWVVCSSSGRDLAAHGGASPTAVAAARVLSDLPGCLHWPVRAGYRQPRGTRVLAIAPTPAAAPSCR